MSEKNALIKRVSTDGRKLKRTYSGGFKASSMRVPRGVRNYISKRGTPEGSYEFVRTVTGKLEINNAGIGIGASRYHAGTWVVTPQNLQLISGVAGNSNTYNIPNAAEFAALFDKIKIDKVEFTFSSANNTSTGGGGALTSTLPNLMLFAEDDNDSVTSPDQIRQMDCVTWQPGYNARDCKVAIVPKYQRIVYYTSLVSSYEPSTGYVVSDTAIPHYGLKMGIDVLSDISNAVNFSAKVYFKCKELK